MPKRNELVPGKIYRMTKYYDGRPAGTEVIFKWLMMDDKWAVCNPVGQPSMQDSICLDPETELEEIQRMHSLIFKIKDNLGRYTTEAIEDIIDNSKIRDIKLWSGLRDCNGQMIFEGDRISFDMKDDYWNEQWEGTVLFKDGVFGIKERNYVILRDINPYCLEII